MLSDRDHLIQCAAGGFTGAGALSGPGWGSLGARGGQGGMAGAAGVGKGRRGGGGNAVGAKTLKPQAYRSRLKRKAVV